MIPQVIHYCWFGGNDKPKKVVKCIESWKKYNPAYKTIEWNESNIDLDMNPYTRWCYDNKKFAFLTDYLRLLIIYQNGGIYFDTDVEVVKNFDSLLMYPAFFGFETDDFVNTGVGFGAEPKNEIVGQMLKEYDSLLDGKNGVIGCPHLNTRALKKFGLNLNGSRQSLKCAEIFPAEYFNPYDAPTGRLNRTKNTYSIHWYAASWMTKRQKLRGYLTRPIHRFLGVDFFRK